MKKESHYRWFSPRAGAAVWAPQPVCLCPSQGNLSQLLWLVARPLRRSGTCTWRPPTNKELHRQWKPWAIKRVTQKAGNTGLKCTFLMAAGSKSSLSIYGVIAFPIDSQVEETHHAQVAQYINTNDTTYTAKKCTWITLSGMLSLSKLNKRSKRAFGSCKISWQLYFCSFYQDTFH